MNSAATHDDSAVRDPRLWPAGVVLVLQAITLILTVTPSIQNSARFFTMMLGPLACLLLFLIWLVFFSRTSGRSRLLYLGAIVTFGALAAFLAHITMRVALWIYGIPLAMFAITTALFFTRQKSSGERRMAVLAGLFLIFGSFTLFRLEGFTGGYVPELSWRWASYQSLTTTPALDEGNRPWQLDAESGWSSFRGPTGNGAFRGPDHPLDWRSTPPQELWRIPVGAGWSSFAYASGRLFTQEQRGEDEVVSCYDVETGANLWQHRDNVRFTDMVAGPGPRSTPALADGRLFSLGATALLNALDASDGTLLWQRDLVAEVEALLPVWGFSGSPLVVDDKVVVYAGGKEDNGLLAYDVHEGEMVWRVLSKGMNFSSAQQMRLADQHVILFADSTGLLAIAPKDGDLLWRYKPADWEGAPIVQTQQIGPNDLVIPLGDGSGLARVKVQYSDGEWDLQEVWSSRGLKPSFNDFVFHRGHLYGFDQNIFACLDVETGQRCWKKGRYGFGQMILLENTDQLVLVGEKGEVLLLAADPSKHQEMGRVPVLEGKTWNHPIVADGRLIVRNGSEAVALDLVSHLP